MEGVGVVAAGVRRHVFSSPHIEASAAREGIALPVERVFQNLTIEGDSLQIATA